LTSPREAALVLALLLVIPALANAGATADGREIADELKAIEDPSIFKRRVWLDTEWSSFKDSSDDLSLTLGALWAWRVSANQDWGLRIKVPLEFHTAGDTAGDSNEQGLGDLKVAVGTAFRLRDSLRTAAGLEMRFPTASDNLGANVWRPMLFGVVAWDVQPGVTFSPSGEYNKSIKELRGTAPQEFLELFFPVTFVLQRYWAVSPRYELKADFANDNRLTHSGKLSVTKRLEDQPLAFTLSIKKSFDGGAKKFQVNFVATHYFQ
jgi:hypothetical protein